MSSFRSGLGVQSWSLRDERVISSLISRILASGFKTVELCAVHADFDDPHGFMAAIRPFHDAGIAINSIGCQVFTNNPKQERRWFECARLCNARLIGGIFKPGSAPQALKTAAELSREFGIPVGIHNHGAGDWLGSPEMLAHILDSTGPEIGLLLDTAWMIDSGQDPVAVAERFSSRLYGLHIKDFSYDTKRRYHEVVVGEGLLDLPGLISMLKKLRYRGTAVIEYEVEGPGLDQALRKCADQVALAESGAELQA